MTKIVPDPKIASAYVVVFGLYGDVTRHAQQRGVSRQWVYRQAHQLLDALDNERQLRLQLQQQLGPWQQQHRDLQQQLARAVVLDDDKQAEVATVGQARGVSLPDCWALLDVLIPGRVRSVATLGRWTQEAGKKAGPLLAVMDEFTRPRVRDLAADEIYVTAPVLMTVEPESLCWLTGQLSGDVSGASWSEVFVSFGQLEQVTRDGGTGLAKGVALLNQTRQEHGVAPVIDQGDHYHALRGGGLGLRRAKQRAEQALAKAEAADKALEQCRRRGQKQTGPAIRAKLAWRTAEQAMDRWCQTEQIWERTTQAMRLFTPDGHLNTRAQAEEVLAETLEQLPEGDFAKTKRQLCKPEMLNYLDRVQTKLAALPYPEEVKQAAVRQEGLRRQPELLRGESQAAAARRGVLLMCAVVLSGAGAAGTQAVSAVRDIVRRAYRASSVVEGINSVLRMQQARHRKLSQGMLDLKRLYWNSHRLRTGHRRKTTPYERLGVPWPEGMRWWDVLKLTPEQLRDKLSTTEMAA